MGTFVNPQSLAQIICPFCETLIATPVREMRNQPVFRCPCCDGTLSAATSCQVVYELKRSIL